MAQLTEWDRLVRYVSTKDGEIRYGEPILTDNEDDVDKLAATSSLGVRVFEGMTIIEAKHTGEEDTVQNMLGPLTPAEVSIIRCTGLNYKSHSMFISGRSSHIRRS